MAEFTNLFHSDTATVHTVYRQLLDWLTDISNTGNNIPNVALNLGNRAQDRLWRYKSWDYLVYELTLSGAYALNASRNVTLPTDFGREVWVGHDSDGDGKPEYFYYRDARAQNGYTIRDTFAKSTGHSFVMHFFQSPSTNPVVAYMKTLPDFTGSGTEYSYFPGDILFAQAKLIHLEAAPIKGDYEIVKAELDRLLMDYVQQHQYVNPDMRSELLDDAGLAIDTDLHSLDGESGGATYGFDNDYDLG